MSDGEWRIWQHDTRDKTRCDVVPVRWIGGQREPLIDITDHSIQFAYNDGSRTYYPWANIVRAEYDPPTNP